MPNVLSPRDLVSRPDNMDETVLSSWGPVREFPTCSYFEEAFPSIYDNSHFIVNLFND